jgi:hypothetical protein
MVYKHVFYFYRGHPFVFIVLQDNKIFMVFVKNISLFII